MSHSLLSMLFIQNYSTLISPKDKKINFLISKKSYSYFINYNEQKRQKMFVFIQFKLGCSIYEISGKYIKV